MTRVDGGPPTPAVTDSEAEPVEADADGSGADEPEVSEPRRRRWRRSRVWLGLAGAVVVAAGGVVLWTANRSTGDAPNGTRPAATAIIERGTISATESWEGTLERGTPFTVRSGGQGTVTRLAAQGTAVGRGEVLFRVDEQPVVLLTGVVPMYRDLRPGDSGADVEQLETNLAALGYGEMAVDARYDMSTSDVVRAWQQDIGAAPTGTVARGQVVFAPEGGQVDTVRSQVGDLLAPGAPVLDIVGPDQVVNLDVDVDDRDWFALDAEVTVLLPGSDDVAGTITRAAVVEPGPLGPDAAPGAEEGGADIEPVVRVEVALGENASDELVGSPVEVVVPVDRRSDVLLVPVTALLALAEGGYGLEVVADDGTTAVVPVETGLFAGGQVEVESPDIAEGTVVGVAGR
jgi:peptidoglycan hydrolase-like protein with peptidoglycan-binding domain